MKNMTKFFALAVVILGFSASSFAQKATATATATASAMIQAALTIDKTANMNFGNLVAGVTPGTVWIDPTSGLRDGANVVLLAGPISAAKFTVTGAYGTIYTITLPRNNYIITREGGNETMTVNTFISHTSNGVGGLPLPASGTIQLAVGATLNVGVIGANPAGVYTNATGFEVTIGYE